MPHESTEIGRSDYIDRLDRAASAAASARLDALLISPGSDLRYLIGYDAIPMERLTCLVLRTTGEHWLVVPELETAAAQAAGTENLGLELVP